MNGSEASRVPIVVLGAGPAGLGMAFRLARRGDFDVTVLERHAVVGGNAGSFLLDGVPVDFGSHRLHPACPPEVLADIRQLLGPDLLDRPRHGRIRLRGRWLHFPLRPVDLALHVPPGFAWGVLRDALSRRRPEGDDETFASILERGLGRTICREFYFPYAEKIWGLPATAIDGEQARRRVSAGSIGRMLKKVVSAIPGIGRRGGARFFYPRGGYGQISEAYRRAAEAAGAHVVLNASVQRLESRNGRGMEVVAADSSGEARRWRARQVLSTIPLPALASILDPGPPADVREAMDALRYRAMLLVYLVLEVDRFTEYDAHYFPDRAIHLSRLSEPKNYGLAVAPGTTVLCAELPVDTGAPLWQASDADLGRVVCDALAEAGLPVQVPIRQVATRRLAQAYPIYTRGYRDHFDRLDGWVGGVQGLVSFGRQGLFAHDNTHHALAMAYALDDCLDDRGQIDSEGWATARRSFERHVVED